MMRTFFEDLLMIVGLSLIFGGIPICLVLLFGGMAFQ